MLKTHSTRHTLILYLVCFRSMYWLKQWMIVWWWICCCCSCCWCCRRWRFTFSNYSYCVLLPLCMHLKVDVVLLNAIALLHEIKHTQTKILFHNDKRGSLFEWQRWSRNFPIKFIYNIDLNNTSFLRNLPDKRKLEM